LIEPAMEKEEEVRDVEDEETLTTDDDTKVSDGRAKPRTSKNYLMR
jgi:hypothetical protein